MEGTLTGSFNELTMQNGIPLTTEQQLALIEQYGGLDVWGGELVAPHYAATWAWAGNCPFQWGKQVASHLGGTRQGMAIRYPRLTTSAGGLRSQFIHCIDIGPTILELAGLPQPTHMGGIAQTPMHGTSFLHTFADPAAEERHTQQYFEIYGFRAMYKDGWWLAQDVARLPWDATPETLKQLAPGVWQPDNDPVLAGISFYFGMLPPLSDQTTYTYYGDVQNVASGMIPRIYNHSYTISADLDIPADGAEGVIVAEVDHLGGFSLFVEDGRLKHTYSMMGVQVFRHQSDTPLPTGEVNVRLEFHADAPEPATGGDIRLFANGTEIGKGRMDRTVPWRFSAYAGMDIGGITAA